MSDLEKLLENEVAWIAEQLISTSEEDEHGVFWRTLHRQPYGKLYAQVNEEIYNGVSGITLFFISLYRHQKESKYLEIAQKSINWSIHYIEHSPVRHYTFYTGSVGVIYSLIKMYEATRDKSYLDNASQLFSDLKNGIAEEVKIDDLLSGNAGNLFVIAYLYTYTGEPELWQMVSLLISRLISNARISRRGLKWGYLNNALDSTTGMSHGASGIAHVLLEVARAIDYPELNWIAEKAFAFEDEYYSWSLGSWIDMRISPHHKANEDIVRQGVSFYLRNSRDVNAWAHGTAGMGLSRLNAYELLQNERYKRAAEKSVEVTIKDTVKQTSFSNFTLSTGMGSWMELYMKASEILDRPGLKKQAGFMIRKAIEHKNTTGFYASGWYADKSDAALMVGTAGIGHLFLQLLDPGADSVLLPKIKSKVKKSYTDKILLPQIRKIIYGKYLTRTIFILEKIGADLQNTYDCQYEDNILELCNRIRSSISNLPSRQRTIVLDVFKLELIAINMSINPDYNIYREQKFDYFKQQMERAEKLDIQQFETMNFIISRHVRMIQTKWPWPLNEQEMCSGNLTNKAGSFYAVLRLEIDRLEEFYPNQFSTILLKALKRKRSFAELMELLKNRFAVENDELLKIKLVDQLKVFSQQWFIEIKEK